MTYKFSIACFISESCLEVSMLIWVRVSKNGQSLGRRQIKCESRLRELDQLLRASDHPLEFMCQVSPDSYVIIFYSLLWKKHLRKGFFSEEMDQEHVQGN